MNSESGRAVQEVHGIIFDVSESRLKFRVENFGPQEPDLLNWINDHYRTGDIFFDIGANIGYFSLYAAKHAKVKVLAFEPEALTYATLNRNIYLNAMSAEVQAICICFHDRSLLSYLNLRNFVAGNAYNTFSEKLNYRGEPFSPEFQQASIGITVDQFIEQFNAPFPNHIKMDVDGNEDKIISGMPKTLDDSRLRTLSIELTKGLERHSTAIRAITAAGFVLNDSARYRVESREAVGTQNYHFQR